MKKRYTPHHIRCGRDDVVAADEDVDVTRGGDQMRGLLFSQGHAADEAHHDALHMGMQVVMVVLAGIARLRLIRDWIKKGNTP